MSQSPVRLYLLGFMPGTVADERALHDKFSRWRRPGTEWFYRSDVLMEFIHCLPYTPRKISAWRSDWGWRLRMDEVIDRLQGDERSRETDAFAEELWDKFNS